MKKLSLIFLCYFCAFCVWGQNASSSSELVAQNESLKAQITQLTKKLEELRIQLEKQTKDDFERLAKLREENRELKKQLRDIKLDKQIDAQRTKTQAPKMEAAQARVEKMPAAPLKREVPIEEEKKDSVWNHMFPF